MPGKKHYFQAKARNNQDSVGDIFKNEDEEEKDPES
jgi:hypothetical protein